MRLASLSRRPLARLAAAAAALTLLAAGCLPLGEDEPAPGDDPATQDDGDGQDGQQEGPELAELGTSAAQELPTDPAEDAAYAAYYEQGIEWGPCEDVEQYDPSIEMQCGTVTVPLVWDDPDAGDIDLAVARQPAQGEDRKSTRLNS